MIKLILFPLIALLAVPISENIVNAYFQTDLIPENVWAQYPLIAIFLVGFGWFAWQWKQNEERWREFIKDLLSQQEQRNKEESDSRRAERKEEREQFIEAQKEERLQSNQAQMELMRYAFEEVGSQQVESIMAKLPQYEIEARKR